MTKKKVEPLSDDFVTVDVVAEEAPAPTSEPAAFDFTQAPQLSDGEVFRVYNMLRRKAILAKDSSALPDGKTYTQAQIIEILGEDYEKGLAADPKCCG
jgi:hypothetical protein